MNTERTVQHKTEDKDTRIAYPKQWEPYIKAVLGFRNHWYPALFSTDLKEGELRSMELLGEQILFKRVDGAVYAVADFCAHRGFQFSRKPECWTKNTITCWVHGFTFNLRDGSLVTIPSAPNSPLIGKMKLRSYPVQEIKNSIIFVFVGDLNPPPPLADDVHPGLLDPDMALAPGVRVLTRCNWRLGADTCFDPPHIWLHKEAGLLKALGAPFPLAEGVLEGRDPFKPIQVCEGPGPKGFTDQVGAEVMRMFYEAAIECEGERATVSSMYTPKPGPGFKVQGSEWLPCCLKVDPWPPTPDHRMVHFEWYVPIDEHSHMYTIVWGKKDVKSTEEAHRFLEEVETRWRHWGYDLFNVEDVTAREGMERYYTADERGWEKEWLCEADTHVITWRRVASKHNRGIQKRGLQ